MKTLEQFQKSLDKRTDRQKRLDETMYSAIRFGSESWETFSEVVLLHNKIETETDVLKSIRLLSAQNVEIARLAEFAVALLDYESAERKVK